ncbi:MAG: aldo/keto reductase, partial [Hasllibacter sp.]
LGEIADGLGRPMAQVAIAWLTGRPGVASVLLGARTAAQLEVTLGAADLVLDDAAAAALTRASAPGLPPYPYGMLEDYAGMEVWRDLGTGA